MKLLTDLIYFLNSLPSAIVLAFLAFLVSVISAYNSSRAIRLSQRAEKRSIESEANAKQLRIIERQNEITILLNDALIDLSHANTLLKLCRLSLPNLLEFFSDNISCPSQSGYQTELEKTIIAIRNIEVNNSNLESDIRKAHQDIRQQIDMLEIEKHFCRADVLRKTATMEFQKAQNIYQDLMRDIEKLTKITFQRKGIEI